MEGLDFKAARCLGEGEGVVEVGTEGGTTSLAAGSGIKREIITKAFKVRSFVSPSPILP